MSNIPIVQGVAVDTKYQAANDADYNPQAPSDAELSALRVNPIQKYQDVIWGVLFVAHLVVMVGVIFMGMQGNQVDMSNAMDGSLLFFFIVTTGISIALSILSMTMMMNFAIPLVKAALIFSVGFSLLLAVYGFMSSNMLLGIAGAVSFVIGICYARVSFRMIPGRFNHLILICNRLFGLEFHSQLLTSRRP